MFEIGIGAYIGAGNEQRGFDYDRQLTLLIDLRPWSLLMFAATLVLLVTSATALIFRAIGPILVFLACAVALLSLRAVLGRGRPTRLAGFRRCDRTRRTERRRAAPAGDRRSSRPRGTPSPEANERGWTLLGGEEGFRARGLDGWWLLLRLTIVVSVLTAFRVSRLFLPPWSAVALTAVGTFVVFVWILLQALGGLE